MSTTPIIAICCRCRHQHPSRDRVMVPDRKDKGMEHAACPKCKAFTYHWKDIPTGEAPPKPKQEERITLQIAPNASATFNTPTPSAETVRAVRELIKLAMAKEAAIPPQHNALRGRRSVR